MNSTKKVMLALAVIACLVLLIGGLATPVAAGTVSAIRFAIISDYGSGSSNELGVSNLVHSWSPNFIVTSGDNDQYTGTNYDLYVGKYYHDYIYPYQGIYGAGASTNKFWPAPGNHDWGNTTNNGLAPYKAFFTLPNNERYYDFVRGPVHFFILDGDSREPDGISSTSVQATWLKNKLASSPETYKVVLVHQPPYSSGVHGSTNSLHWPFKTWGASVVFSGHDHDFERLNVGGLTYFVGGVGGMSLRGWGTIVSGSQFRNNTNYGAMLVTADTKSMVIKFYSKAGSLISSYTIRSPRH